MWFRKNPLFLVIWASHFRRTQLNSNAPGLTSEIWGILAWHWPREAMGALAPKLDEEIRGQDPPNTYIVFRLKSLRL
jgi:hypothetical protein